MVSSWSESYPLYFNPCLLDFPRRLARSRYICCNVHLRKTKKVFFFFLFLVCKIAAVLLQSKGRSASVAGDERANETIINRHTRSVSNQIEEDAVNGLLVDLLSPMVEDRRNMSRSGTLSETRTSVAHAVSDKRDGDSDDSGVSDSSEEGDGKEDLFFPDNLSSPKLGRTSSSDALSAAELLRRQGGVRKPPPSVLESQASVLSWRDYLIAECPVCEELKTDSKTGANGTSVCAPCGARVCKSCVLIFKRSGAQTFVRVCRKCRDKVPVDGEMVCGVCCSKVLGKDTRCCTECDRHTCVDCCRLFVLKTLGETEPRAVCIACVSEVQAKLSAYPRMSLGLAASSSPAPEHLERKSSGTFWKALKSPRKSQEIISPRKTLDLSSSAGSVTSPLKRSSSKKFVALRKSGLARDAPFPGVKLHFEMGAFPGVRGIGDASLPEVPESIAARKTSRPPPLNKVTFADIGKPERVGLVQFDFFGEESAGHICLSKGQAVHVYEERRDGWGIGSVFEFPQKRGLFRLENVTFDPVLVAAAAAQSGGLTNREGERSPEAEVAKYRTGSFVRSLVGTQWTECEVLVQFFFFVVCFLIFCLFCRLFTKAARDCRIGCERSMLQTRLLRRKSLVFGPLFGALSRLPTWTVGSKMIICNKQKLAQTKKLLCLIRSKAKCC
jgi:hypothetical protein